jgi:hypothetical protein
LLQDRFMSASPPRIQQTHIDPAPSIGSKSAP